jgi:dolichol-phosphate mannosyltransferase
MDTANKPRLTVICPVFNEALTVPIFFSRMQPVLKQLAARYQTVLLFVNNASTDGTLDAIKILRAAHPNVYYITLSSNVGYQRSLECGIRNAKGDLFVMIDVDCEDPPEKILDFVHGYEKGYDVVYGERIDREEWVGLKLLRKLFYRFTRAAADEKFIVDMAEFLLMTSEVRDAVVQDRSSFPFIRASIGRIGFRIQGIPYKRQARVAGKTHYNLVSMSVFAMAGILSSSTLLLRLPLLVLPLWFLAVVGLGVTMVISNVRWALPTLIVVTCAYLGGTAATIAVYLARVYKNTLGRPNYIIDRRHTMMQD